RVSSAASSRRSTTTTVAPSRANRIAVALPLPIVSPGVWPPPTTIATLPFSLSPMRRRISGRSTLRDPRSDHRGELGGGTVRCVARAAQRSARAGGLAVAAGDVVADRRGLEVARRGGDRDRSDERHVVAGAGRSLETHGVRAGDELLAVVTRH